MEEHGGAVLVTDHGRLVGIVSERECARAALKMSSGHQSLTISEIMAPCAVTVSPSESLYECLQRMNESRIQYLPLLESGKPVGVVSREQVLAALVTYLERVFHEFELDQQIVFLRGTYSC
jgi:predicted transcriptional regulator